MVASLRSFLPGGLSRAAFAVLAPPRLGPHAMDALIQRAKDGDTQALEAVLKRHAPDVARIAHRMLGPSADLDDVVQEALFQVARSLRSFQGHSKFSTWLYRVVANVARMHLRAKASRPQLDFAEPTQLARNVSHDASPERCIAASTR
jgi:RNA polymerase sigma-70 factor (ECF subfamily)